MSLKSEVIRICIKLAYEQEGWKFNKDRRYINKILGHTDIYVNPGLTFKGFHCIVDPGVAIDNKRIRKLYSSIFNPKFYGFSFVFGLSVEMREKYRIIRNLWEKSTPTLHDGSPWPDTWLSLDKGNVEPYIRGIFCDGVDVLYRNFDFASEEDMLRNLPVPNASMADAQLRFSFYEESAGVNFCLARLLLGDFDFIQRYRSDEIKTIVPKKYNELDKIMAVLPELKARYEETGSVI